MNLTQRMNRTIEKVEEFTGYLSQINCTEPKTKRVTICYEYSEKSKDVIVLCNDCTNEARRKANRLGFRVHTELLRRSNNG